MTDKAMMAIDIDETDALRAENQALRAFASETLMNLSAAIEQLRRAEDRAREHFASIIDGDDD